MKIEGMEWSLIELIHSEINGVTRVKKMNVIFEAELFVLC
jgi:hypothetical protein